MADPTDHGQLNLPPPRNILKHVRPLKVSPISAEVLIFAICILLALLYNHAFFHKTLEIYPWSQHNGAALGSMALVLIACFYFFLGLICWPPILKPTLVATLLTAALISYVMGSYGVVLDETMILNSMKTDPAEVRDLLSVKLAFHLLLFGVVPSIIIWKTKITRPKCGQALYLRFRTLLVTSLVVLALITGFGKFYASFFREHKELRSYVNPLYFAYSIGKYAGRSVGGGAVKVAALGRDSRVPASDRDRDLFILVVGETARADHFSLNGYPKETNPMLKQEGAISLPYMWSCGTSTAISVPCMFSNFGRSDYSDKKGQSTENLLDILSNTKHVSVLWRDNNSDSKGVAVRVPYEDFKTSAHNPICDEECRDEGMLAGLQGYIDRQKTEDILIVLHQMGNHGPAYYKRYPSSFEKFKPSCRTNELENCSAEEISNAYDNAILYTDYFLAKVIALLKRNSDRFETGMLYVSDHGESLGEHGVYLHGLPYMIAPDVQKRPAAAVWLDEAMKKEIDGQKLRATANTQLSHDNIFHSVLGFFEVETKVYRKELDIFH